MGIGRRGTLIRTGSKTFLSVLAGSATRGEKLRISWRRLECCCKMMRPLCHGRVRLSPIAFGRLRTRYWSRRGVRPKMRDGRSSLEALSLRRKCARARDVSTRTRRQRRLSFLPRSKRSTSFTRRRQHGRRGRRWSPTRGLPAPILCGRVLRRSGTSSGCGVRPPTDCTAHVL